MTDGEAHKNEFDRLPGGSKPLEIEFRWKEEVIVWDGERGCIFDSGWGTSPRVTYVPDEATWDMPLLLR